MSFLYWIGLLGVFVVVKLLARFIAQKETSSDLSVVGEIVSFLKNPYQKPRKKLGECKMVLVVRKDLKMKPGKIAAQCGHASLSVVMKALKSKLNYPEKYPNVLNVLKEWHYGNGTAKIVLRVNSKEEMHEIINKISKRNDIYHYLVVDAGRTQIDAGSETVLGILGETETVNKYTGHLSLF